ncbi:MAG: hypothetical protein E7490_00220 [Ruminococcaceae bacterium]|nr:hypothetical protein [Oscillospiraceae bacterium]
MFNNIGRKIKSLVKVLFVVSCIGAGILVCLCVAFTFQYKIPEVALFGLLIAAAIVFFSWIGSFVLYGFGDLVENSDITQYYTKKIYDELHEEPNETTHNTGSHSSSMSNFRQQALGVNHTCWTCKNCKEDNPNTSVFCQNCGDHK